MILDSVRAKNVGHLGYSRDTTPNLDEFTERATAYTNARSPGIHSISSHVSIFTGYHVAEHRATSHGARISQGHTIWETLADKGYRTGLFTPNSIVAESSNLASFFQEVVGPKRQELWFPEALGPEEVDGDPSYVEYLLECLRSDSPFKSTLNGLSREFGQSQAAHDPKREHGGKYVDEFDSWRESRDEPWAACINLMDAHYPYIPQKQFAEWGGGGKLEQLHREAMGGPLTTQYLGDRPFWELEATKSLYDDCIKQADAYVGQLLERLESAGELDETLIVITSDHGEGFGEYSVLNDAVRLIDHSWGIGDEVSHIPLVVKSPSQSKPERVEAPASLTNFPSVVEAQLEDGETNFVAESKGAITTSYRVREPAEELPIPPADREPYFGPWHALCHEDTGEIVVDAVRQNDEARYWPSQHVRNVSLTPDRDAVESFIESVGSADVFAGENEIGDTVQKRLSRLGYTS